MSQKGETPVEKHKALIERSELWLWVKWVLASAVGGGVGGVAFANSFEIARGLLLDGYLWELLGESVVAGVGWSVAGIAQWLILRRRVRRAGWWVLASTVGSIVGMIGSVPVLLVAFSLIYAVGAIEAVVILWGMVGCVVGIAQWLILRRRVFQAGWWVLASTVGGVVAAEVAWAIKHAMSRAIGGAMGATVVGAITGFVLILLLRHPAPEGWNA